jgi:RNA polymerase sigma-70 factor (ECF subfamily)
MHEFVTNLAFWPQAEEKVANATLKTPRNDAFTRLFSQEFRYVWMSLRRLGVRASDLDDVTHDVFLAVHRHFPSYDPSRPPRPWLFAFCFRAASDYRNSARIRKEGHDPVDPVDPGPLPDQRIEENEARALAREGLAGIDLSRRAVFILFEIDEVPMTEVAASLGIPLHTAYSRLRLAREDFAQAVARIKLRRGLK